MTREHQPDMFGAVPQPRRSKREDAALYYAVRLLRRLGHRVYRSGRDTHSVNGQRITTAQLLERAGA
jgi:hypothetical protein